LDTDCGLAAFDEHGDDSNWICNQASTCPPATASDCGTAALYDDYKRTICGGIEASRSPNGQPNTEDPGWICYLQAEAHRNALANAGVVRSGFLVGSFV